MDPIEHGARHEEKLWEMSKPVLRVNRLCVEYKSGNSSLPTVENVTFSLDQGTTLGIIGESGAGKTTLALALLGLLDLNIAEVSGEVILEGRNLLLLPEKELCRLRGSKIGIIFQDPVGSLDPAMKIDDQVAEAIRLHRKTSRREALELARQQLAAVGISKELLDVAPYAHQLSGGLCQRAMIAVALAARPIILIADEPTSSLDVTLQAQILSLLKTQQRQAGLAMIFISHDLALVSKVADCIMVMHEGKMVELGSRDEVLNSPRHLYTSSLVSAWRTGLTKGDGNVASA